MGADIEVTAQRHVPEFQRLAGSLGVDLTANTGTVVHAKDDVLAVRLTAGIFTVFMFVLQLPALYFAAKIITPYEVAQGLVRYLTVICTATAILLIFLGSVGLIFTNAIVSVDTLTWIFALMISLGVLMLPVVLLGFLAADEEDVRRLRFFRWSVAPLVLMLFISAICLLALGDSTLNDFVAHDCRGMIQQASAGWLESFAPGVGCTKYYGQAIDILNGSLRTNLPPSVGGMTNCFNDSHRVYAWEYATDGCGSANLYGW